MRILPRRLLVLGGAVAIAAGGFAYMASNAVGASNAGQGTGTVSGYSVTDITYGLTYSPVTNVGDPQDQIPSVTFDLSPTNATFVASKAPTPSKTCMERRHRVLDLSSQVSEGRVYELQSTSIVPARVVGGGGGPVVTTSAGDNGGTVGAPCSLVSGYGSATVETVSCNITAVSPYTPTPSNISDIDIQASQ